MTPPNTWDNKATRSRWDRSVPCGVTDGGWPMARCPSEPDRSILGATPAAPPTASTAPRSTPPPAPRSPSRSKVRGRPLYVTCLHVNDTWYSYLRLVYISCLWYFLELFWYWYNHYLCNNLLYIYCIVQYIYIVNILYYEPTVYSIYTVGSKFSAVFQYPYFLEYTQP